MSAPEERGALTPRLSSLYACALRVEHAEPEGPWSRVDAAPPVPRRVPSNRGSRDFTRTRDELTRLLGPLLVAPDPVEAAEEVHRRLDALDPPVRHRTLRLLVAGMPVENEERARALARVLVRTGTGYLAVCTGLALLTEQGEPQDVPYLRTLGRLRTLAYPVIHALDALDRPAGARLELRNHREPMAFGPLFAALDSGDRTAVRERLVALPEGVGPEVARRVAEASWLVDLLAEVPGLPAPEGAALIARAGRLLFLMTTLRDYQPEILSFPDAPRAYEAFARGAGLLPTTLDHHALLLSAVQELSTGPAVLHAWGPGRREGVLSELVAVLGRPEWRVVPDEEGDESGVRWRVVWSGWRGPVPAGGRRELPELRFDAFAYDAEIARASGDESWMWPARRAARLVAAGLRGRPDLLARWSVRFDWAGTAFRDPDETLVSLLHDV
ncbi:hypothetical protein OHR86_16710 [Streptomyces sp. NBC_00441]|uniref:hypothetical protein n=1 Tax=Streptomyces sp. NBC_00441 TaxID=2975742 RepID=UPI002E2DF1CE|nr:hypothetical protein [Streptomyces sp. NBC_00441]